jgi:hypothetical protein
MFANRICQVPIDSIHIDRETRQRSIITYDSIIDLAYSIGRNQWISPLLVDESTNFIVAGERRLTAVKALCDAMAGNYDGFSNPMEARTTLFPVCTCKVDSWSNWSRVPVQFGRNLTPQEVSVYEFIENAHREDLCWQDRAKAIFAIHSHGMSEEGKEWFNANTAQLVGISPSAVGRYLKVWRTFLENPDNSALQTIIKDSLTLRAAEQNLERHITRREDDPVSLTTRSIPPKPDSDPLAKRPGPPKGSPSPGLSLSSPDWSEDEDQEPASLANSILLNEDFTTWAASYTGQPFNFIHCDFPYGISFNKGEQARSVASTIHGEYDDDEDVYWNLLNTLAINSSTLLAESCHILFWFSQNLRRETEDFFTNNLNATIQSHLMIWHCSDQDGIVPDSQRYGRRTYETAMLVTLGDRKIVAPRSLSFAHPRESKSRIHRSQKPLAVLNHFLSMFVDDSSSVLDPTAGSGTSLIAASHLNASRIVGLERDPEIYKKSISFINSNLQPITL